MRLIERSCALAFLYDFLLLAIVFSIVLTYTQLLRLFLFFFVVFNI